MMNSQLSDQRPDDNDPRLLEGAIDHLLEQISMRDQKIAWIQANYSATSKALAETEQALTQEKADKDLILRHLRHREGQVNEILSSKAWRIAESLQRTRILLIPPGSRRAQIL